MFNWIVLGISIALLMYLGGRAGKRVSDENESDFLVAGRTLGPFVLAGTVIATGFSGWGFMGSPGAAYKYGSIELLGNFLFAPGMVVAILFFARYLRNRAEQMGSNTIPEFVVNLHCSDNNTIIARVLRGVTALGMVVFLTVFLTGQIRALGMLGGTWLHISPLAASAILLIIIAVYTLWGGLLAVAWTDTLMVVGMSVAAIYMTVQIFTDIPLGELVTRLQAVDSNLLNPESASPYGDAKASIFLVFIYALVFSTALPYMSVRFMAMKRGVSIAKTGIYAAVLGCILSIVPLVGMYVRLKNPELANPDDAMPWYLSNVPPMVIGSIITLFILFAMKSTANSILHTLSTAVSHDLRLSLFSHSQLSGKKILQLNRLWVILVAFIGFVSTFFLPKAMLNFLGIFSSGTLMAALSGVLLVSVFYTGTAIGALASMLVGATTSVYLLSSGVVGWVEGPLLGVLASAIVYVIVSAVTKHKST